MTRIFTIAAASSISALLAGCAEEVVVVETASETPSAAEQGCLRDVTAETGNGDVTLLSSDFSQAGTEVIVGVGEQRARWRCIGYDDGTTAEVMSLTDEGAL